MLTRTLTFLVAYAFAAWLGRVILAPGSDLAIFWPAAGVGALWGLLVRSRREALAMTLGIVAVLLPMFLLTGFTLLGTVLLVLANLAVAQGTRGNVDIFRGNRPFRRGASRPAWVTESTSDVSSFVIAAALAVAVSGVLAVASLHANGAHPDADDLVAHVFRNLAAVVLVAGTGVAVLSRDRSIPAPATGHLLGALGTTCLIAALVFGPGLHMPMGHALLLPLFWSAIHFRPSLAMAHAAVTCGLTLVLILTVGGHPFGPALNPQALATRYQLFCVISGVLALVISTAMAQSRALAGRLAASEHSARVEAQRLATVTTTVPDGLAIVTSAGDIEQLNRTVPGYLRHLDSGRLALPARPLALDGTALPDDERPCHRALSGHAVRDLPVKVAQPDGTIRTFEVSATPLATGPDGASALLSFRDATVRFNALAAQAAAKEQLAHQAEHDALTGLLNRHGFEAELAHAQRRWAGDGDDSGLLLLDLDNFKNVNDTLGHTAGDELLVALAQALRSCLRGSDVVARLGGDEFAVVLPGADLAGATRVGHEIVGRVAATTRVLAGEQRRVTASVGVVSLAAAARAGADPMVLADMLMYEAKDEGRNTVAAVDPVSGRTPRMGEQLAMRRRVEDALDGGGLELFLQPILDIRRGRVRGAEALLRMREDGVIVPPAEFMPVVERTGLAVRVDSWVAAEALRIARDLRRLDPSLSISANVSGPSVGSTAYLDALSDALDAAPAPEGQFVLEVTETAAVADMARAQDFAGAVRARGIGLALDDFGAGFGSFSYLKHLDFSYLKIDGEFVRALPTSHVDQSIVRSLVAVARDLGKETVAEHVTGPEVLEAARSLGVDHAQGYAIGRPVPVDEFVAEFLAAPRAVPA